MFISGATLQFNQTRYSASEAGPPEVDVCVVISDLTGELQCDLVVTLDPVPGDVTGTYTMPTAIMRNCIYLHAYSYSQMMVKTSQRHLQECMRQHFHLPQQ